MASYTKFAESGGARVVSINWRDSDKNIIDLVSKLNGVIFPGGGTELKDKDGKFTEYTKRGKVLLDKIKEMNNQGIYVPVLGICLGFQELSQIEAPYKDTLELYKFDADDVANNVTLFSDVSKSKLFKHIPQHLLTAIQKENITYNHHHDGILPPIYSKYPELREYYLLGVSYDQKGLEYVAIVENKKYPFYGLQFHPEKNLFIWKKDLNVPHSPTSIELSQYISNFFIGEARKNFNHFGSEEELFNRLVENDILELTTSAAQDIYLYKV